MAAALKSILGFAKKAIVGVAKGAAEKKATETLQKNGGVVLAVVLFIISFLLICMCSLLAGPVSFSNAVYSFFKSDKYEGLTQDELNAIIDDAGKLRSYIKDVGFDDYTSLMFGIDKKTALRILDAVADYNEAINTGITIEYEYRIETISPGESFPTMDRNTGVVTGSTEGIDGYKVTYDKTTRYVSRSSVESQELIHNTSQSIFRVRWQPIMALCCMRIIENSPNWGKYTIEDGVISQDDSIPNYYLSDKEIDEIIRIFVYQYQFVRDIRSDDKWVYRFDDFMNYGAYGFEVNYGDWDTDKKGNPIRTTRRMPKLAPYVIQNAYISYEYVYDKYYVGDLEGHVLTERILRIEPQALIDEMKAKVAMFDEGWFLLCLEQLPLTEDLCEYYDGLFQEPDKYKVDRTDKVGSGNTVFVFGNAYRGPTIDDPEGGMTIPLYSMDTDGRHLVPGEWIVESGNSYGSYYLEREAIRTLLHPDLYDEYYDSGKFREEHGIAGPLEIINGGKPAYISYSHIEKMLNNFPFTNEELTYCPLLNNAEVRAELAQCLWDYMTENQCSASGFLAIIRQEGGFRNTNIAVNGWNFFNISTYKGDTFSGVPGNERFRNYKKEYEGKSGGRYKYAVVNAFYAQINWVYLNYWAAGQDTFYSMSFNGYDVNNPQKAYEGLKHCYCPPWDDKAMPYSKESYITWDGSIVYHWKSAGVNNKGWVNGCAMQQRMFLQSLYSQSAQGESSGTAAQSAGQKRGTTSLEKKLIE